MNKNQNSLPIIQSLWIGGSLSVMEQLCISSFISNGHTFHLYTYGDIKNAPDGVIIKDANEIINSDRIFKYKDRDTYAGFSNIFRYKLVYEKGNYWVDTDVVCLRPFDSTEEYVFTGAKIPKFYNLFSPKFRVGTSVIKTPHSSEIMKYCYELSSSRDSREIKWGEIGPIFFETAVIKFGLQEWVTPHGTFSTVNWPEWGRYISHSVLVSWIERIKITLYRSRSIHLFNEMWRLNSIDKNERFPQYCIYEQLKNRYLITV